MSTKKSSKLQVYIFIVLIIAGISLACSSVISNDYIKLAVVMVTLGAGLYGIMKSLSGTDPSDGETATDK